MSEKEVFSNFNSMVQEIKEFTPEEQQKLVDHMKEAAEPHIFKVFVRTMEIAGIQVQI